jgi:hypothetical protein
MLWMMSTSLIDREVDKNSLSFELMLRKMST